MTKFPTTAETTAYLDAFTFWCSVRDARVSRKSCWRVLDPANDKGWMNNEAAHRQHESNQYCRENCPHKALLRPDLYDQVAVNGSGAQPTSAGAGDRKRKRAKGGNG